MSKMMFFPHLNQSGLLFMPGRWQRAGIIRWLKRIHAWTGFWGALLFLMLGISGVLLNHRTLWKIETGEPLPVSAMNIAVDPRLIRDEKALGTWAIAKLGLRTEARPAKQDDGGSKIFLGRAQPESPKWVRQFNHANGKVTVEYIVGSTSVFVRQDAATGLGFIKNLHKGTGVGVAWILFMDSIAGALIAMSLTGVLLWSRLHGGRLLAGGILIGAVCAATSAIWPFLL
jgi:uncharacterized protein